MFHLFGSLIGLGITFAAVTLGYWQARRFTANRLRYVDAVHKGTAPVIAGVAAAAIALPIVWVLPFVGTLTALFFGAAVATGVSSGAREIRRRIGAG